MGGTQSPLLSLSAEVLEIIASFGTSGKYLRTTCKDIEAKIFDSFCKRYFRTRQIWVDRRSLQNLKAISEDAHMGPTVHHVIVTTHNYHRYTIDDSDTEVEEEEVCRVLDEALQDRRADQNFILQHGYAAHTLVCIMDNLVSLKTIRISQVGDWTLVRPDDPSRIAISCRLSNSMVRSGRPYPTSKLYCSGLDDMAKKIWMVVITAVSTSNRKLLSLNAFDGGSFPSLKSLDFDLPRMQLALLANAFSNLEILSLGLDISDSNKQDIWDSHLPKFLGSCPKISDLSLHILDTKGYYGSATPFDNILNALPTLRALKDLTIHYGMITSFALNSFLHRHEETLRTLTFCWISLHDGAWPSLKLIWAEELLLEKIIILEATSEDETMHKLRYSIAATGSEIQYVEGTLERLIDETDSELDRDESS